MIDRPVVSPAATWSVMIGELEIAGLVLGRPRQRRIALALATALHIGIAAVMGLYRFSVTIVGLIVLAYNPDAARGVGKAAVGAGQITALESLERIA
jgi:hypothetical protein